MSLLTASEVAKVDAFINSPDNLAWEAAVTARWARQRGEPAPIERYRNGLKEKYIARRNATSAKRHTAKLNRTPPWANHAAIKAVYVEARRLTASTGTPHHVDHEIPLQGRLVCGLHVENNLQILPGPENCRKNNRYEVGNE